MNTARPVLPGSSKVAAYPIMFLALLVFTTSSRATESVLYSFQGSNDGGAPVGGLIHGPDGSFYGTAEAYGASGNGVVYQLLPPSRQGGAWTETVLYSFQGGNDGSHPYSDLVRDPAGNLYGVTYYGGGVDNFGTVYEVSPDSKTGLWTEKVIYAFQGPSVGDGCSPNGGLYLASSGVLFGTTVYCGSGGYGTVFMLAPPSGKSGTWKEKVIYSFTGGADGGEPFAGLLRNSKGIFYGVTVLGGTFGMGTVFSLTEDKGLWSEAVLHSFVGGADDGASAQSALYLDAKGNLFGTTEVGMGTTCPSTTQGCGMVFELSANPSGGWTETILYVFQGDPDGSQPWGRLISDGNGTFWGTTLTGGAGFCNATGYGCGTVFELSNTSGAWIETVLYSFQGGDDGQAPQAGVVRLSGKLYGTTNGGGSAAAGTIFEIE